MAPALLIAEFAGGMRPAAPPWGASSILTTGWDLGYPEEVSNGAARRRRRTTPFRAFELPRVLGHANMGISGHRQPLGDEPVQQLSRQSHHFPEAEPARMRRLRLARL